jgi:hypothetical protein
MTDAEYDIEYERLRAEAEANAPKSAVEWNPTEALYAFAGWLTSRPERITLSATDLATPAADAVAEFQKRHGLPEPREGWHRCIIHPMRES